MPKIKKRIVHHDQMFANLAVHASADSDVWIRGVEAEGVYVIDGFENHLRIEKASDWTSQENVKHVPGAAASC